MSLKALVLTGAPGTGKTTLIEEIRRRGILCFDEPARRVLAQERARNGTGLPERDAKRFVSLLLECAVSDYEKAKPFTGRMIFDRGIPDCLAYAEYFGFQFPEGHVAAETYRYLPEVFVTPPWEAIYTNDEERKMPFREVPKFSEMIERTYLELGYQVTRLPLASVEARAEIVGKKLLE